MDPFQQNLTISESVSLDCHEDTPSELSFESTCEKLLQVRSRLNVISERSQVLNTGVESLRRLLTAQAHRDGKSALEQLEELRKLRVCTDSRKG